MPAWKLLFVFAFVFVMAPALSAAPQSGKSVVEMFHQRRLLDISSALASDPIALQSMLSEVSSLTLDAMDEKLLEWMEDDRKPENVRRVAIATFRNRFFASKVDVFGRLLAFADRMILNDQTTLAIEAYNQIHRWSAGLANRTEQERLSEHFRKLTSPILIASYLNYGTWNRFPLFTTYDGVVEWTFSPFSEVRKAALLYGLDVLLWSGPEETGAKELSEKLKNAFQREGQGYVRDAVLTKLAQSAPGAIHLRNWISILVDSKRLGPDVAIQAKIDRALFVLRGGSLPRDRGVVSMDEVPPFWKRVVRNASAGIQGRLDDLRPKSAAVRCQEMFQ